MSRSLLFPLLALGGIILYGTTRAARPAPEHVPVTEIQDGRVVLDEGTPLTRLDPPAPRSTPPPAPRLRSEAEPESGPVPPTESEPETRDSSAADGAAPGGVPLMVEVNVSGIEEPEGETESVRDGN